VARAAAAHVACTAMDDEKDDHDRDPDEHCG
jgi:hypothetical protein